MSSKPEKRSLRKQLLKPIKDIFRSRSPSPGPHDVDPATTSLVPRLGSLFQHKKVDSTTSASLSAQDVTISSHEYPGPSVVVDTNDDFGNASEERERDHPIDDGSSAASRFPTHGPPGEHLGSAPANTGFLGGNDHLLSTINPADDSGEGKARKCGIAIETLKESLRIISRIGDVFPPLETTAAGIMGVFERINVAVKEIHAETKAFEKQVDKLGAMFNPSNGTLLSGAKNRLEGLARALEEQRKALENQFPAVPDHSNLITNDHQFLTQVIQNMTFSIEVTTLGITVKKNADLSWLHGHAILGRLGHVVGAEFNHEDHQGCTPGTRVSLLADLLSWANAKDSAHVFWLNGMAGTGKTTVSETFCSLLSQKCLLGASFFCSVKSDVPRRDVHAIFPSIAKTMAGIHPVFCQKLTKALTRCSDPLGMALKDQYTMFILRPSEAAFAKDEIIVVSIDALDECEDQEATEEFLNIILDTIPTVPLRFFITSRPERQIRQAFEFHHHQLLCLHDIEDQLVEADITLYLTHRLWRITKLKNCYLNNWPPQEITVIVRHAGKLFIYASTISNYLEGQDNPEESLQKVSSLHSNMRLAVSAIEALYEFIVAEALKGLGSEEASYITSCLSILIAARQPISISTYAKIFNTKTALIQTAFESLYAVVSVPDSGAIGKQVLVCHGSFSDYLSSRADIRIAHCQNAMLCFKIMNADLHLGVSGIITSYQSNKNQPQPCSIPFYLACVCMTWGSLVLASDPGCTIIAKDMQDQMDSFFQTKFLFWLEALSVIGEVAHAPPLLHQLAQKVPERKPLRLILSDCQKFATSFLYPIQYSAPHIYLSALPFAPKTSMVSKLYLPKFPSICAVHHSRENLEQEHLIFQFQGHTNEVSSISFSPNGRYIASGSYDRTIKIWSLETGQALSEPLRGHMGPVSSISFSPDGRYIASGSWDQTIQVWNVEAGQAISEPLKGHTGLVCTVSFSPDGKYIASGSGDHTIGIWSVETGQAVSKLLKGHRNWVNSVSFSPNGRYIASGSGDHTIQIWSFESGQVVSELVIEGTHWVSTVSFSPDGRYIASGSDNHTVQIWSVETGQMVSKPLIGHAGQVRSVSFSPDGRYIASGSDDHTIQIWSFETGQAMLKLLIGDKYWVRTVSFSPDGRYIASGSDDHTIRIWSVETGQAMSEALKGHRSWVNSISFSPNGRYIVSGSGDHTIQIWSVTTGLIVSEPLKGHTDSVYSVSFSPNGRYIASGSYDHTIQIWGVETGQVVLEPLKGHTDCVCTVAFSPDGRYLASGSYDRTIRLWCVETGQAVLEPLKCHTALVSSVSFSPDGRYIASGSYDHTIQICSVETGQVVSEPLKGHTDRVSTIAFSPDGRYIASGSQDNTIRIWNVETSQVVSEPLKGHTDWVSSVSFSPDGRHIASGSRDDTICIWCVETGQAVSEPLKGHKAWVSSVSFSPDGLYVASGSGDHTIRIWSVGQQESELLEGNTDYLTSASSNDPVLLFGSMNAQTQARFQPPLDMFLHEYPIGSMLLDKDNHWLQYPSNDLMLWVPPKWHPGLCTPGTFNILGTEYTKIDLSHFIHGTEWTKCIFQQ